MFFFCKTRRVSPTMLGQGVRSMITKKWPTTICSAPPIAARNKRYHYGRTYNNRLNMNMKAKQFLYLRLERYVCTTKSVLHSYSPTINSHIYCCSCTAVHYRTGSFSLQKMVDGCAVQNKGVCSLEGDHRYARTVTYTIYDVCVRRHHATICVQ